MQTDADAHTEMQKYTNMDRLKHRFRKTLMQMQRDRNADKTQT